MRWLRSSDRERPERKDDTELRKLLRVSMAIGGLDVTQGIVLTIMGAQVAGVVATAWEGAWVALTACLQSLGLLVVVFGLYRAHKRLAQVEAVVAALTAQVVVLAIR